MSLTVRLGQTQTIILHVQGNQAENHRPLQRHVLICKPYKVLSHNKELQN